MDNMAQMDIGQVLQLCVYGARQSRVIIVLFSNVLDQTRFVSNEFIRWHKQRYFLEGNSV